MRTDDPAIQFVAHDVTSAPLPGAPADVVYARLLLAHLPTRPRLVEQWRSQVRPGGVVVVDDVEDIEAPPGVLREYEDLVVAMVATEGGTMYAGRLLAPLGGECVEVLVDIGGLAARIFGMNLTTWRDDAQARGLATPTTSTTWPGGCRHSPRPGRRGAAGSTVRWVLRHLVCPA